MHSVLKIIEDITKDTYPHLYTYLHGIKSLIPNNVVSFKIFGLLVQVTKLESNTDGLKLSNNGDNKNVVSYSLQ